MDELNSRIDALIAHVRGVYGPGFVPLHRPVFAGRERDYVVDAIDSNFVSSAGQRVADFEADVARFTGAAHAVATVNGTAAIHAALVLSGVEAGDEVITQPLTFIATCNAVSYCHARPVFVDVDEDTMGLSPEALRHFLETGTRQEGGVCVNRETGAVVRACVPMHTFGLPLRIREVAELCAAHNVVLIEDAAESLGSWVGDTHTGRFGRMGTLSFNGNKVITTGGGGMILTDDPELARAAKHLTTTAKVPHPYEFVHDRVGFNYRLPNLNAALGCAQMETLPAMQRIKAEVTQGYRELLPELGFHLMEPIAGTRPNNWFNALRLADLEEREAFLARTNDAGVMTRPVWRLMNTLPMFSAAQTVGVNGDGVETAEWLEARIVNIPSSVPDARIAEVVPS
ncbi:MAG: LegC family aminotransferase [Pseudomonadota bacterium]